MFVYFFGAAEFTAACFRPCFTTDIKLTWSINSRSHENYSETIRQMIIPKYVFACQINPHSKIHLKSCWWSHPPTAKEANFRKMLKYFPQNNLQAQIYLLAQVFPKTEAAFNNSKCLSFRFGGFSFLWAMVRFWKGPELLDFLLFF